MEQRPACAQPFAHRCIAHGGVGLRNLGELVLVAAEIGVVGACQRPVRLAYRFVVGSGVDAENLVEVVVDHLSLAPLENGSNRSRSYCAPTLMGRLRYTFPRSGRI